MRNVRALLNGALVVGCAAALAVIVGENINESPRSTGQTSTGQVEVGTGRMLTLMEVVAPLSVPIVVDPLPPLPAPSATCGNPSPTPNITACGEETANALILDTDWLCIYPRGREWMYRDGEGLDHYPGRKLQWHGPPPPPDDCNASTAWDSRCGYVCLPPPRWGYVWGRPEQRIR